MSQPTTTSKDQKKKDAEVKLGHTQEAEDEDNNLLAAYQSDSEDEGDGNANAQNNQDGQ